VAVPRQGWSAETSTKTFLHGFDTRGGYLQFTRARAGAFNDARLNVPVILQNRDQKKPGFQPHLAGLQRPATMLQLCCRVLPPVTALLPACVARLLCASALSRARSATGFVDHTTNMDEVGELAGHNTGLFSWPRGVGQTAQNSAFTSKDRMKIMRFCLETRAQIDLLPDTPGSTAGILEYWKPVADVKREREARMSPDERAAHLDKLRRNDSAATHVHQCCPTLSLDMASSRYLPTYTHSFYY
jgi:hypothetical protein